MGRGAPVRRRGRVAGARRPPGGGGGWLPGEVGAARPTDHPLSLIRGPYRAPRHPAQDGRARPAKMGAWTPRPDWSRSQGSFNFRDLGGYPGHDGRHTRWGRLFRSDALHELTADDVARLRELGLRTVVDLRTERELHRSGRGPLGPEPVAFHHLAVVPRRGAGTVDGRRRVPGRPGPARRRPGRALPLVPRRGPGLAGRGARPAGRRGPVPAGLPLRRGQGPDRRAGRAGARAGRGRPRGDRGRLRDHRGADRLILDRWRADPEFAERMAKVPPSRFRSRRPPWRGSSTDWRHATAAPGRGPSGPGCPPGCWNGMVDLVLEPAG